MPETPYVETEALLAVMNGDREAAEKILADFYDSELAKFNMQLQFLRDVIDGVQRARNHQRRAIALDPMTAAVLTAADQTKTWAGTHDLH